MRDKQDGYCGNWDPVELKANPDKFKKVRTPEGKRTTLWVRRDEPVGFRWRCGECDEVIKTLVWVRPDHVCQTST